MNDRITAGRFLKILTVAGKIAVTGCLFISLAFVIAGDYKKIKVVLSKRSFASNILVDRARIDAKARAVTLSHLMPSFDYLAQIAEDRRDIDTEKLEEYARYYEKVVEYLPLAADARGMLGFCYYCLGRQEEAVSRYQESVERNPHFFWSHYNLGVIYFKEGRYKEASESLTRALATNPGDTLTFLYSSKVYQPLLLKGDNVNFRKKVVSNLRLGRRDACVLLVAAKYYLKEFDEALRVTNYALSAEPDANSFLYYYAGLSAYEMKEYGRAASFLQEYIRKNPDDTDALSYLGLCLKQLGEEEMSAKVLRRIAFLRTAKIPPPPKDIGVSPRIF